ncbi:hypothetical protein, partial [Escherichia coli]|uniref:hypothetical protein n=1 Tax=Escherichia coli TaxID=562 RepID=UPI001F4BB79D
MGKGKQTVRVDVFGDLLYEIANAGGGVQAGAISQWRAFCLLDVIRGGCGRLQIGLGRGRRSGGCAVFFRFIFFARG